MIWIFEVGTIFKLWTAAKVNPMENDDLWKLICIQYTHVNHIIISRTPLISYFSMTYANPTSSLVDISWMNSMLWQIWIFILISEVNIDPEGQRFWSPRLILTLEVKGFDLRGQYWPWSSKVCMKTADILSLHEYAYFA